MVTAEDDEIRSSLEDQQRREDTERLSNASPIQRKPLPLTPFANYPATERPPIPPKSYPYHQPGLSGHLDDTQAARLAARGTHLRLNTRSESNVASARRKPVGPRSLVSKELDERSTVLREAPVHPSEYRTQPDPAPIDVQGREPWPRMEAEVVPALPPRTKPDLPTRKPTVQEADRIVLIRRDPSSGSQWNVGTITVADSGLSATVEINTPGYQKFAKQDLEIQLRPDEMAEILQDETVVASASTSAPHAATPHFIRTIDVLALSQPKIARGAHQRNRSDDRHSPMEQTSTQSQSLLHSKSVFTSPWRGRCFFTTGLDGRCLKCRHVLPMATSTDETSSEIVCELRFNLPWLRMRKKNNQRQGDAEHNPSTRSVPSSAEAKEVFRRSVQRLRSGSGTKMFSEDEKLQREFENIKSRTNAADQEQRLDLSLGQEKAGGGFRGSSAKLGKLIIENEGLKFADLVVGACMSIWWTHYSSGADGG